MEFRVSGLRVQGLLNQPRLKGIFLGFTVWKIPDIIPESRKPCHIGVGRNYS